MVVPHRVVQEQPWVPASPAVAHPLVLLDANVRDPEELEPRAQAEACLAAPDDEHVRVLGLAAERSRERRGALLMPIAPSRPRLRNLAYRLHWMAQRAADARGKRASFERLQTRSKRERLAVLVDPHVSLAVTCCRSKCDPALCHPAVRARARAATVHGPAMGRGCGHRRRECLGDLVSAFESLNAPCEGHHVPPIRALRREALMRRAVRKPVGELSKPMRHTCVR